MNKVVVTLEERDLLELQQLLLDEDETGALAFLKCRLAPQIPVKGTRNCDSSRCNPYLLKPPKPSGGKAKG